MELHYSLLWGNRKRNICLIMLAPLKVAVHKTNTFLKCWAVYSTSYIEIKWHGKEITNLI